jgi:hypothetical protein
MLRDNRPRLQKTGTIIYFPLFVPVCTDSISIWFQTLYGHVFRSPYNYRIAEDERPKLIISLTLVTYLIYVSTL